jgi:hypothetical protein
VSNFVGLDQETISKLMGESRQRNTYGPKLMEFINSDEAGINPADAWPVEFGKKNASTLYQGFLTAAKKANVANDIRILQNDGNVFLLHKERASVAAGLTSVTEEDEADENESDESGDSEVAE